MWWANISNFRLFNNQQNSNIPTMLMYGLHTYGCCYPIGCWWWPKSVPEWLQDYDTEGTTTTWGSRSVSAGQEGIYQLTTLQLLIIVLFTANYYVPWWCVQSGRTEMMYYVLYCLGYDMLWKLITNRVWYIPRSPRPAVLLAAWYHGKDKIARVCQWHSCLLNVYIAEVWLVLCYCSQR